MDDVQNLIERYKPLLKSMAWRYKVIGYDDCYQEAVLGLIIAHVRYDPRRGTFGSFAKRVIQNRLNRLYRDEVKQPFPFDFVAADEPKEESKNSLPGEVFAIPDEEYGVVELIQTLTEIASKLGEIERKVLAMKTKDNDITQVEMAQELGVSQATIVRVIKRIAGELSCHE